MNFNSVDFSKFILVSIFFHSFSVYFLGTGVLGTVLFLISSIILILMTLGTNFKLNYNILFKIYATIIFFCCSMIYLIFSDIELKNKLSFVVSFLLPFITLIIFTNLKKSCKFIVGLILAFVLLELFVCLGQMSTYFLGIGFPVSEEYLFMITGTFYNSNDLASIVLSCCLFILICETTDPNEKRRINFIWLISFFILIITMSRTALLIYLLIFSYAKRNKLLKFFISFLVITCLSYLIGPDLFLLDSINSENGVQQRITDRINSIFDVFESGVEVDGSLSLRLHSYEYFLSTLSDLSWGAVNFSNYEQYFYNAKFDYSLISKNPHSLFIELSYWQGYVGLFSFIFLVASFISGKNRFSIFKLVIAFIFVLITTIPSSSMLLYPIIFLMFYCLLYFDCNLNSKDDF